MEAFTRRVPAPWVGAFLPSDRGRGLPFFVVTSHDDGSEHTLDHSNDTCAFSRGGILIPGDDATEGEAGGPGGRAVHTEYLALGDVELLAGESAVLLREGAGFGDGGVGTEDTRIVRARAGFSRRICGNCAVPNRDKEVEEDNAERAALQDAVGCFELLANAAADLEAATHRFVEAVGVPSCGHQLPSRCQAVA